MKLLTTAQAAAELGLSMARLRILLAAGRIGGARKHGRDWAIPSPVWVLPPAPRPRPKRCPYAGCAHNRRLPDGRRRCAAGLVGIAGRPCPEYTARPGLSPRQQPRWARAPMPAE